MLVNDYQKAAMTTLNPALDKKDVLINSVMGLCGESGEAIDIVKKWLMQGHELDKEHLIKELGDVAWYPGGCRAESVQTIGQELERNAHIVGTKGSIFLPDFQHAETMTLEVEGKEPEGIRCPVDINGFEYEIREASRCVKLGRTGSDRYTPQDSLSLTRLMYDTRMSWGMKFAGEA